jgi:exopolyphosphatase/guanosine-5'-triphosphate,3'-diphosphate pyrophosphatase
MPVRLGTDSFLRGEISDLKKHDLIQTVDAFHKLIQVYRVQDFLFGATSALREATNGREVIKEVKQTTGVDIELLDGETEASLIYNMHVAETLNKEGSYLYIDVGGGSTELTLFNQGQKIASRSFLIGTIRLLESIVDPKEWTEIHDWINEYVLPYNDVVAIGTGGNINKLFKITNKKEGTPLSLQNINYYYKYLNRFTYDELIDNLGLRPDRADVIIHATGLYLQIMKWANIQQIIVPKIGLSDGIIRMLYEKWKNT